MARPRQELRVARRMGQIELGLHAHQRYLSLHGTPNSMAALADHALMRNIPRTRVAFDALVPGLQQHV
jgi:hypothetical protein